MRADTLPAVWNAYYSCNILTKISVLKFFKKINLAIFSCYMKTDGEANKHDEANSRI
jgi:hypothetical protein